MRRSSTLATAGGIALVVFVLAASLMLSAGVRKTLAGEGRSDRAIVTQEAANSEVGSRFPQPSTTIIASLPGVARAPSGEPSMSAEAVVQLALQRVGARERMVSVQVRGVTPKGLELRPNVRVVRGRLPQLGADEAMVGVRLVGNYEGLMLGGHIELKKERPLAIVGVFEAGGSAHESEVWAGLDSVLTSVESVGYVSSVTVDLASESAFGEFASALGANAELQGLRAERERAYCERLSSGLSAVIVALGGIVTLLFAFGAVLGAAMTMYAAVGQRSREIGVLIAIGFSRTAVLMAFVLESVGLAACGSALGVSLSYLTSFIEFSMVNSATFSEVVFNFVPSGPVLFGTAAVGVLVGLVGGILPAVQASAIDPIRAMRG